MMRTVVRKTSIHLNARMKKSQKFFSTRLEHMTMLTTYFTLAIKKISVGDLCKFNKLVELICKKVYNLNIIKKYFKEEKYGHYFKTRSYNVGNH